MATVTASAPPRVSPEPVAPLPVVPATVEPKAAEKGMRTDWVALLVWTVCFGSMGLLHLADLIARLFR